MYRIAGIIVFVLILTGSAGSSVRAQQYTVWEGAYTEDQAAAGRPAFRSTCSGCHGATLGGGSAVALSGDYFMEEWREDTVGSLYSLIKNTMPPRSNNRLEDTTVVNIVSFILQSNGFPSGQYVLTPDAGYDIRIEGRNGPQPLPSYAAVQVVGCLAKGEGSAWDLVNVSNPRRTRTPGRTLPDELEMAHYTPLGRLTLRLQNLAILGIFRPAEHEGHKVYFKGALIREDSGDRLSVTAVEVLDEDCR